MKKEWKEEIEELVKGAKNVYVSSVDENGYPNTKAMNSIQREGLGLHFFSTNFSSKRVSQFKANPKACIYYCNEDSYRGLMLLGRMEVCTDLYHRKLLWRDVSVRYYPKGVTDDDYCVYKFTAEKGRYYPASSETFDISELMDDTYIEINKIINKFAQCGWDLIAVPSKAWLEGNKNSKELISAIVQADKQCGSCGCEYDDLYKRILDLREFL